MTERIFEICLAINVAILTIAYPIMVNQLSQLGQRYKLSSLKNVFDYELPQRKIKGKISFFEAVLILSLLSFIPLIFQFSPPSRWDYWFINHSANIFALSCTVVLIAVFFTWVGKLQMFIGNPDMLLERLSNKYFKASTKPDLRKYCLLTINELTLYAIQENIYHLEKPLQDFYDRFYYSEFNSDRPQFKDGNYRHVEFFEYPDEVYEFIVLLNERISNTKTELTSIEYDAVSGIWLLGSPNQRKKKLLKISKKTYKCLWECILHISERPNLMENFIRNSYSYYGTSLGNCYLRRGFNENLTDEETQFFKEESKRFLGFHIILGGLLLYQKQYDTIEELFYFPEKNGYEMRLYPKTINDILIWLFDFQTKQKETIPHFPNYFFPGLRNLKDRYIIHEWIGRYLVVVLIKQRFSYSALYKTPVFEEKLSSKERPDLVVLKNNIVYLENIFTHVVNDKDVFGLTKRSVEDGDQLRAEIEECKKLVEEKISKLKNQ